jgi:hypothetical protein
MQELNLRLGQAVALTYAQTDDNFKRLKTAIDALEVAVAGAGLGTVTSVGLTMPNIFTVTNSPVTTTGSLTATLASQSANRVFASPTGASGQPTFRILDNVDLPVVSIAKGGLNLTTVATANQVLASTGSVYEGRTISVSGGLTLTNGAGSIALGLNAGAVNINDLLGVLVASKGGTGVSAAPANGSLLIGNGVAWTNTTLTAGTGIAITNGVGSITISTSGTVTTAGGTAGTFPIFTTASAIGNSLLTYASAFGTGTLDFASGEGGSVLKSTGTVSGEIRAGTSSFVTYINASATDSNLGWTNAKALNFIQGSTTRASFDASGNFAMNGGFNVLTSGNVQTSKGFALNGLQYWNTASNYAFANNEQYGVILGPTSPGTMTVTLPTAPIAGQEICILTEEDKTLTVASGVASRNIYGQAAVAGVTVVLAISLNTHGSAIIFKFSPSGNGGTGGGAWYLTGF